MREEFGGNARSGPRISHGAVRRIPSPDLASSSSALEWRGRFADATPSGLAKLSRFYDMNAIPPMLVVPVRLDHPEDPVPMQKAKTSS